jgi:hypothetical protein
LRSIIVATKFSLRSSIHFTGCWSSRATYGMTAVAGHDHADVVLVHPVEVRQHVAGVVRRLGRRPHRELTGSGVIAGRNPPALHRVSAAAGDDEPLAEPVRSCAQGLLRLARNLRQVDRHVVLELVVHPGCVRGERRGGRRDRRQHLVVDVDQLGGVLGDVPGLGHDDDHRLAHEVHSLGWQRIPRHVLQQRVGDLGRDRLDQLGKVSAGPDADDARKLRGLLGVDGTDPRRCVGAAHERRLVGAGQLEVVEVAALTGDQPAVLAAGHRGADHRVFPGRDLRGPHGGFDAHASSSAVRYDACEASSTASTMPA